MAMRSERPNSLVVRQGQRLVSVSEFDGSEKITRLYVEDIAEPDTGTITDDMIARARSVIGAWDDLDWGETVEALDRIRHESRPTPPIDEL
jgi:hypothetical protein